MTLRPPWAKQIGPFPTLYQAANWIRAKFLLAMGSLDGWPYNTGIGTVIPVTIETSGDWSPFLNGKLTATAMVGNKSVSASVPAISGMHDLNLYITYLLSGPVTLDLALTASNLPFVWNLGSFGGPGAEAKAGVTFDVAAPTNFSPLKVTVTSDSWASGAPVKVTLTLVSVEAPGIPTTDVGISNTWQGSMTPSSSGTDSEFLLDTDELFITGGATYQVEATIIDSSGNSHSASATITNEPLTVGLQIPIPKPTGGGQGMFPIQVTADIPYVGEVAVPDVTVYAEASPASGSTPLKTKSAPTDKNGRTGIGFDASQIVSSEAYTVSLTASATYTDQGKTLTISGSTSFSALGSLLISGVDFTTALEMKVV